jgi:hypothetical protein
MKKNKDGTVTIYITDIIREKKFQGRSKLDKATLRKYTQMYLRGQELDPIEITQVGKVLILTDGWHRMRASELAGKETIKAVIKQGDRRQAFFNAIIANLQHGLQIKKADKRLLFRMYMKSGQYLKEDNVKSLREIAQDFNQQISHMTVKRWMKEDFKSKYRRYYTEEEGGNGRAEGFQPLQISEEPVTFFEIASEAINNVRLMSEGIKDEKQRGKLIWEIEWLLEKMKEDNRFEPFDPLDEY